MLNTNKLVNCVKYNRLFVKSNNEIFVFVLGKYGFMKKLVIEEVD